MKEKNEVGFDWAGKKTKKVFRCSGLRVPTFKVKTFPITPCHSDRKRRMNTEIICVEVEELADTRLACILTTPSRAVLPVSWKHVALMSSTSARCNASDTFSVEVNTPALPRRMERDEICRVQCLFEYSVPDLALSILSC